MRLIISITVFLMLQQGSCWKTRLSLVAETDFSLSRQRFSFTDNSKCDRMKEKILKNTDESELPQRFEVILPTKKTFFKNSFKLSLLQN